MSRKSTDSWKSLRRKLIKVKGRRVAKPRILLLRADARTLLPHIPAASVSCIITSPPYVCRKDYGTRGQIGFGQDCNNEYLPDLQRVFSELFRIAKPGAALWMVVDTVKEAGETVPLPLEVITRAGVAGWTFHDLIVWDKGKNLPWSNPGRFRGVCEYIILLGRGKLAKFDLNAVRDSEHLSPYWVKYPERYHPDGKAPTDLWHFPIPTQGSWSKDQMRHYCPFPIGLVARMLAITTDVGDIVLDPFSGTGSVVGIASHMGRHGIGIEINSSFVREFAGSGYRSLIHKAKRNLPNNGADRPPLRKVIIDLRMLKYARTLFAEVSRSDRLNGGARESIAAFLLKSATRTLDNRNSILDSHNLGQIELDVLLQKGADKALILSAIKERMAAKPLSIFGVRASVKVVSFSRWNNSLSLSSNNNAPWFIYRSGKFYHYDVRVSTSTLLGAIRGEARNIRSKVPSIFSRLQLALEKPVIE